MFIGINNGKWDLTSISTLYFPGSYEIINYSEDIKMDNFSEYKIIDKQIICHPIPKPLNIITKETKDKIKTFAANKIAALTSTYHPSEVSTFLAKFKEAQLYKQTKNSNDCPWLTHEATFKAELAQKNFTEVLDAIAEDVIQKGTYLQQRTQFYCGVRGGYCALIDEISVLTDISDTEKIDMILAIDYTKGWE